MRASVCIYMCVCVWFDNIAFIESIQSADGDSCRCMPSHLDTDKMAALLLTTPTAV